jgi:hypothetical protein
MTSDVESKTSATQPWRGCEEVDNHVEEKPQGIVLRVPVNSSIFNLRRE